MLKVYSGSQGKENICCPSSLVHPSYLLLLNECTSTQGHESNPLIHTVINTASLFHRLNTVLPSRCFNYAFVCLILSEACKNLFSLMVNEKKKASLSSGGMSTHF